MKHIYQHYHFLEVKGSALFSHHLQLFFAVQSSFESNVVKSEIRYAIFKTFKNEKIEIPFPQRTISFLNPPKSLQ